MPTDQIVTVLDRLIVAAREMRDGSHSNEWPAQAAGLAPALTAALRSDSQIAPLEVGRHFRIAGAVGGFRFDNVAGALIERAVAIGGAAPIVDSLRKVVGTGTCGVVTVAGLKGMSVSERFRLSDELEIVPPDQVRLPAPYAWELWGSYNTAVPPWVMDRSLSALQYERTDYPAIHDGPFQMPPTTRHADNPQDALFNDAVSAFTLAMNCAPRRTGTTTWITDIGWPGGLDYGIGYHVEPWPATIQVNGAAREAVAGDLELVRSAALHPVVERALRSLRAAARRTDPLEKAMDLGSCMEMLLMHDGSGDNAEISFKLRQRGAWLLGRSGADRLRLSKVISKAYGLRSQAIHRGQFERSDKPAKLAEYDQILFDAEQICSELLRSVIRNGWPDWNAITLQTGIDAVEEPAHMIRPASTSEE